jgi:hypothetical protein
MNKDKLNKIAAKVAALNSINVCTPGLIPYLDNKHGPMITHKFVTGENREYIVSKETSFIGIIEDKPCFLNLWLPMHIRVFLTPEKEILYFTDDYGIHLYKSIDEIPEYERTQIHFLLNHKPPFVMELK